MKKIIFTVFIFVSLTISCTQVDEEVTPEISNNYLKEIKFNTNSSMFDYVTKTKSNDYVVCFRYQEDKPTDFVEAYATFKYEGPK